MTEGIIPHSYPSL